ncbi:MAG: type II secretion system F family protein [Oscillospiraceae bacterium]|nr:type II secretion system F family protein [Oscillospiraceae bacterium]
MCTDKLTNEDIGTFCLSLYHLIHAGLGVADAFALMAQDERDGRAKRRLEQMTECADRGESLARICRQAECFPDYVCALLDVGEQVGRTEQTLEALARHYEGRTRLERRLRGALLYPCALLGVMLAVVVILLIWVLPVFDQVYAQLGSGLTGVAGGLLVLGQTLRRMLPAMCILLVLAGVLLGAVYLNPTVRRRAAALWRRLRGAGGPGGKIEAARVAQALALGMSSGLTDEQAVELALSLAPEHGTVRQRCRRCLAQLEAGQTLAGALRSSELLPGARCRLLDAAVKSGRGEAAMEQIALQMLEEGETALESAVSRIEPALVMVTSALVGAILLTVMLPLAHIMSGIG